MLDDKHMELVNAHTTVENPIFLLTKVILGKIFAHFHELMGIGSWLPCNCVYIDLHVLKVPH